MAKTRQEPIKTPPFILSYPNLIVPKRFDPKPGEAPRAPRYGCVAIFPPETDLEPMKVAARKAREAFFGGVTPRGLRNPFRDCEEYWKEDATTGKLIPEPGYMKGGHFVALDAGDRAAPDCRDQKMLPITDASKLYAGCRCIAVVRPAGFDFEGKNKGVKFYLLTLQKIGEGENIAGRVNAADYFQPVEELAENSTTGASTGDGWDNDEDDESF